MIFDAELKNNVVRLSGGLGNQMFQYIFGKSLELKSELKTHFDTQIYSKNYSGSVPETIREYALHSLQTSVIESPLGIEKDYGLNFSLQQNRFDKLVRKLNNRLSYNKMYVQEEGFFFNPQVYNDLMRGRYYIGYWQSPSYFALDKVQIRAEFKPKLQLNPAAIELQNQIINTRGICLNVRRGDYLSSKAAFEFHGLLGKEYYLNALDILRSVHDSNYIYIFSDDLNWCSDNFKQENSTFIVPYTYAGPNFVHYMELMKSCSAFVIPNSTFGWWAAFLSDVDGSKIISPINWFRDILIDTSDLIPMSWTRI